MAVYQDTQLRYVGNVGTGFDTVSLDDSARRLQPLEVSEPPFSSDVLRSRPELGKAHWAEPGLVAKVEHRGLTTAGRLRAPSFQGFRDDKRPEECTFEQLIPETR
jgi:bifunctional non-homologous end joining protein LigD